VSESRQRWRVVFGRDEDGRYLSHLDAVTQWERALRRGRVPMATSEGFTARPRLIFAAPLQLGMLAEHELADLYLAERLTRAEMRSRLGGGLPRGYGLVDLWDEWIGAPALAPQLAAADYRMTLPGIARAAAETSARALLDATELPRHRRREKAQGVDYDLRPLLIDLRIAAGEAGTGLWMRLRHQQEGGTGRPEEVVAALAEASGPEPAPLEMARPVRERLWLAGEL
jgi:radical SAM-linked protein